MATKPESRFRKWFVDQLFINYPDCYVVIQHGSVYTARGVPDVLMCFKGKFYGFELKMPKGKATKLQLYNLNEIKKAGGVGLVIVKGETMPWEMDI